MKPKKINDLRETYKHMIASRYTDYLQADAAQRGEVFFYIPSSGHEATATIARHLIPEDWLHLHYRDRALAYARGVSYETVFNGLFSRDKSNSAGRRMPAFPCDKSLNILSTPTLVGSNVVQAVGVAHTLKNNPKNPIVLASVGDGSTQQGDFYEAIAEASRNSLPVLFLIEDNRFALSTITKGNTFYSLPDGSEPDQFYGINIHHVNGSNAMETDKEISNCIKSIRENSKPSIILLKVERLSSHTNADDQSVYRTETDLNNAMKNADPCSILREHLINTEYSLEEIKSLESQVKILVDNAFEIARNGNPPEAAFSAKRALPAQRSEYLGANENRNLTMLDAMREALKSQLKIELKF